MGGGGGTGRLYKTLVRDKQLAVSASASSRPQWYVGAFQFSATPRIDKGVKPEDLEKEIWAEIDKVKANGLTEDEIQKAKNKREAMFIRSLGSTSGLAGRVGRADLMRGWRVHPDRPRRSQEGHATTTSSASPPSTSSRTTA